MRLRAATVLGGVWRQSPVLRVKTSQGAASAVRKLTPRADSRTSVCDDIEAALPPICQPLRADLFDAARRSEYNYRPDGR
jgi:hypothetical protein